MVFYPKRSKDLFLSKLYKQCLKCDIKFVDEQPEEEEYDVVLDAIFGFSFKGEVRSPFDKIIKKLSEIKKPILSIDVPSGNFQFEK
jgi:NAD(P)H-hydrate epimerase